MFQEEVVSLEHVRPCGALAPFLTVCAAKRYAALESGGNTLLTGGPFFYFRVPPAHVVLYCVSFEGPIPRQLGQLKRLRSVAFFGNGISGEWSVATVRAAVRICRGSSRSRPCESSAYASYFENGVPSSHHVTTWPTPTLSEIIGPLYLYACSSMDRYENCEWNLERSTIEFRGRLKVSRAGSGSHIAV